MSGPQSGRPPVMLVLAMLLVIAALVWRGLGLNSSRSARDCRARYDAALTSSDTLTVDAVVPDTMQAGVTCGALRYSPAWD